MIHDTDIVMKIRLGGSFRTKNIGGLAGAGELFKYDGCMPDVSHYDRIEQGSRFKSTQLRAELRAAQTRLLTKAVGKKVEDLKLVKT